MDRVQRLLDDARAREPDSLVEIGSPANAANPCRTPLTLVIDPGPDALVCTQEVFGPILPVKTYEKFDEVIDQIQADERPLGIYIFSDQPELIERLRRNTSSGGFCVNAAALQGAQANLGFGGVGNSGMGRHHGLEGFREFPTHAVWSKSQSTLSLVQPIPRMANKTGNLDAILPAECSADASKARAMSEWVDEKGALHDCHCPR